MIDKDDTLSQDPDGITEEQENKPSSILDDENLFARLRKWYRQDRSTWANWKKDAAEDYEFFNGEQWSSEDRAAMRQQMRPIIAFNRIQPVISAVSGTEIGNRQEIRYFPRQQGTAIQNEIATNAAKWFREQCNAEDEESDAFLDALIAGVGNTETRLDYEVDEEGAPLIDRVDPFEMLWDSAARKRNFEDARRVFRVKRIPKDEARALVPDADDDELDAKWAMLDDRGEPSETRQEARFYRPTPSDKDGDLNSLDELVTIVECQWWEREPAKAIADPQTGKMSIVSEKEYATLKARMTELGMPMPKSAPAVRRCYYRAYLGKKLLTPKEDRKSPFGQSFSYKAMTGFRDKKSGTYYGLVRSMKDPQRWANKWLSQTLHILNTSAKGSPIVEAGVFKDIREAEQNWARPDKFVEVDAGTLSNPHGPRIQPKPVSQLPTGYTELMQFAIASIRDASGINLELLGMQEGEQAGVLEMQRKKQAMAVLAAFFDSLRRYRKEQGRLLLFMIQNYLSDGRLIRITGESGQQYIPLMRDATFGIYDVVVDDAPSSPQQKEMTWQIIQSMLPLFKDQLQQDPALMGMVLEQSPLPASLVEKLKQEFAQRQQGMQQQQQEQAEIGKAGAVAKVEKEKSAAVLNYSKAGLHEHQAMKTHAEMLNPAAFNPPPPQGGFPQ